MPFSPFPLDPNRRVRVVLSSMGLLPFVSVWKAAAFALAELGCAAFFISGVLMGTVGDLTPWLVLTICLIGLAVRSGDIESWAMFIQGGLVGRAEQAFGPRAGRAAASVVLIERVLLAALASVVIGRYVATVAAASIVGPRVTGHLTVEELSAQLAMLMLGLLWIRARTGLDLPDDRISRGVWVGVGLVTAVAVWGGVTVARGGASPIPLPWQPSEALLPPARYLAALAIAL